MEGRDDQLAAASRLSGAVKEREGEGGQGLHRARDNVRSLAS